MVSKSRAWHEADRVDRQRYSQPARLVGEQAGVISFSPSSSCPGQAPPTLYSLLGVERSAGQAEIRRAYRRLLVAAHPDKGGDPERFQQLKAAFTQLSDPGERLVYDERLDRMHRSSSCCNGGAGGAEGMGTSAGVAGQGWRRKGSGVTAVLHGQTQGRRQQQQQQEPCSMPLGAACPASSSSSSELQQVTMAIQELLAGSTSSNGALCPSRLASAHLQRAEVHRAVGQLHHALFDAEEALRLQPGHLQATALVGQLQEGIEALQLQQAAAATDSYADDFPDADELEKC